MKTILLTIKILVAIWPEVIALVRHIQSMIPKDEQKDAVKHVIVQGKKLIAAAPEKVELHQFRTKSQLEVIDGE